MEKKPYFYHELTEEGEKILLRKRRKKIWLNLLLFLLTLGTTLFVGILNYLAFEEMDLGRSGLIGNLLSHPEVILKGLYFAGTIMAILLAHESGHYLACRYYGIDATLPYFIPAPTIVGTFGAFIKIRSPIVNRRALFDIGIAGPLSGFLLALPTLYYGLRLSRVIPIAVTHQGLYFEIGEPLLFKIMEHLFLPPIPDGFDLLLHPMAFAGWFGCLVTAYNLFPVSQLDGGHIAYSIFRKAYSKISGLVFLAILSLGIVYRFYGWFFWAVLILILGFRHPPTLDDDIELGRNRLILGFIALAIFVLTFTPVPIKLR